MRRFAFLTAIFLAAGLATYGLLSLVDRDDAATTEASAPAAVEEPVADEPTADYDIDDPAYSVIGESEAADRALIARVGDRDDHRVRADAVRGLHDGPLVHAVNVRAFYEIEPGDAEYGRLNADQRAVYALVWADEEILNGGFWQFFSNETGVLTPDLAAAAHRVGAPEHEAVFRDAQALFAGGRPPRDEDARRAVVDRIPDDAYVAIDDAYAALQYRRATNLALILGAHVAAHRAAFVAG